MMGSDMRLLEETIYDVRKAIGNSDYADCLVASNQGQPCVLRDNRDLVLNDFGVRGIGMTV